MWTLFCCSSGSTSHCSQGDPLLFPHMFQNVLLSLAETPPAGTLFRWCSTNSELRLWRETGSTTARCVTPSELLVPAVHLCAQTRLFPFSPCLRSGLWAEPAGGSGGGPAEDGGGGVRTFLLLSGSISGGSCVSSLALAPARQACCGFSFLRWKERQGVPRIFAEPLILLFLKQ